MNPTMSEFGLALFMLAIAGALLVWFWRYRTATSRRRMTQMLTRVGVPPELVRRGDVEAIIKDVRSRCRRCSSEDLCERWLAGKVDGGNEFCPNAEVFRSLSKGRASATS